MVHKEMSCLAVSKIGEQKSNHSSIVPCESIDDLLMGYCKCELHKPKSRRLLILFYNRNLNPETVLVRTS